MAPVAKLVAYSLLTFWSAFVIFPIYWVVITAFKDSTAVNQGPHYIPFVDFEPNLDAWRVQLSADPFCDGYAIVRQFALLAYNSLATWTRNGNVISFDDDHGSPAPGFHYVVQLVNESNVTILGATNAAHQGNSAPGGQVPPPTETCHFPPPLGKRLM
jgi:ABC-type maltose transport system permease subunit